jgi:hypothetical protein
VFHVYLHPADYDLIRPVLKALVAEAKAALAERMDELNQRATPGTVAKLLGTDKKVEYRIADPDWTVEFFPDTEDKLARGDIEVHSELAAAQRAEFEGAMTRHITRRMSFGPDVATAPASASNATIYGKLRYDDTGTRKEFTITKSQIVIGRGSKTHWVDLKLEAAPPDVSREHCRIRRDEATGRFFLSDTSQYATTLNGLPVPAGGAEVELPHSAAISLAGVITLEFEAL